MFATLLVRTDDLVAPPGFDLEHKYENAKELNTFLVLSFYQSEMEFKEFEPRFKSAKSRQNPV